MIVMRAKGVEFDVTYINLRDKPGWFLEISPHGKVPVLKVGATPLFESNAIAEFIDETVGAPLHPADPVKRARNRAWTDFVPTFSSGLSACYYAKTAEEQAEGFEAAKTVLAKLEHAIAAERGNDGPYFNGPDLSLVDAAYAPFFQRFLAVDAKLQSGLLDGFPQVKAWADALMATETVTGSVHESFPQEFAANLHRRGTVVAPLFPLAA
ncbi:MAG: glutathione S-transferase family protein [Alphaproteobacteria bacterium]|nr:glutathione S-transferase family protein [Alphaproteobacteria bacterium]